MSDPTKAYIEEDLRLAMECLKRLDFAVTEAQEQEMLAAFRAEARREGYQQGVQEEAERCLELGHDIKAVRQSEREACERIVEDFRVACRAKFDSDVIDTVLAEALRRLQERAK